MINMYSINYGFLCLLLFVVFCEQEKVPNNSLNRVLKAHFVQKRNAIRDKSLLWPSGVIAYELYPDLISNPANLVGKEAVLNAMKHIENRTCIKFKPRTDEKNFISIRNTKGCASYMGKLGGNQTTYLRIPGCTPIYIAVHELMHAVGFAHAHSRHDRDKYIKILWDNVDVNRTSAFRLLSEDEYSPMTEFDFDSIMLYGPTSFGRTKTSITMVSKIPGKPLKNDYEKTGLSAMDVIAINMLYNCSARKI